jgi:prolyl oligopeptidase
VDFDGDQYVTELVFVDADDGAQIPLHIVHKKGIKMDGSNPLMLYGYGGFNIVYQPAFDVRLIPWLENGGVYVNAHIRGGGEYGEEWHQAGTKMNKQRVFDDFILAAEKLIEMGYTSKGKIAVRGGSNGGLLVGAVVNQRPDLFGVALPAVGVMDMLRYHKFTIGWAWASDYGRSDESEEMFKYLYGYSPLHNIKTGVDYPAVLVFTADHDDRVVPAHSFKYIATLQEKYKGDNPVLIRIETKAGHGAGKPVSKAIEELVDMYAFTFYNLGVEPY